MDINYILPSIVSIINNGNVSNLSIVKTITTGNGFVINYYNDGSAIINLTNQYQNKSFVGTIRLYAWATEE